MLVVGVKMVQVWLCAGTSTGRVGSTRASYSTTPKERKKLVDRVGGQQTRVELQKDDPESVYHRPDPLPIEPCVLYPPEVDIASNLSAPSGVKQQRAQSTDPIFK